MQPDEALRTPGGSKQLRDGNRGGIRGENRLFFHHRVERGEHFCLVCNVFDDGLNDDVAISQIFFFCGAFQPGANGLGRLFERAFFCEFGQRFLNARESFVEKFLLHFEYGNIESGSGRDLSDSGAHQAAAQNANFLNVHRITSLDMSLG